mmetsp:Transcript_27055/g.39585  ORF Transcript_27055/g.39585 Transcript_27055/m.39585 type:complete len:224 (-) Transcript_27055:533-1204(-)
MSDVSCASSTATLKSFLISSSPILASRCFCRLLMELRRKQLGPDCRCLPASSPPSLRLSVSLLLPSPRVFAPQQLRELLEPLARRLPPNQCHRRGHRPHHHRLHWGRTLHLVPLQFVAQGRISNYLLFRQVSPQSHTPFSHAAWQSHGLPAIVQLETRGYWKPCPPFEDNVDGATSDPPYTWALCHTYQLKLAIPIWFPTATTSQLPHCEQPQQNVTTLTCDC